MQNKAPIKTITYECLECEKGKEFPALFPSEYRHWCYSCKKSTLQKITSLLYESLTVKT